MKNNRTVSLKEDNIIGKELTKPLSKEDIKNVEIKSKKSKKAKEDYYDEKNQLTNFIREEVLLSNSPPKNTLSFLVFENNIKTLKSQLKSGSIDVNLTDGEGNTFSWTALYWAVKLRRVECINLLLEFGADIKVVIHDYDECCGTVMDLASIRNDIEIETILRTHIEKEDLSTINSFTSLKTRPRGKAQPPSYIFYGNNYKANQQKLTGTDNK